MTNLYLSWINGVSALAIVFIASSFFIRDIYRYKKNRVNLYIFGMMIYLSIALGWLTVTLSLFSVLILGYNAQWIRDVMIFFSYSALPFGSYVITASSWDLTGSQKEKRQVLLICIIISVFYYILLFLPSINSLHVSELDSKNEVHDDWVNPVSFFYIFFWLQAMISTVICAIGWTKFRKFTTGDLKKRALFMVISTPIVALVLLADTVISGEIIHAFIFIPRFLLVIGLYLVSKAFEPSS